MIRNDNDSTNLRRLNEPQAFEVVVQQHEGLVLALAQTMGFRNADLDDAAAEVFAQIYLGLQKFEGRSTLRTWIYSIAYRTLLKLRQRRPAHATVALDEQAGDPDATNPADHAQSREVQQRIWAAVAALDSQSALAVEMHYRQGCGLQEIADVLQCPIGTVKTVLFRAREELRRSLKLLEMMP